MKKDAYYIKKIISTCRKKYVLILLTSIVLILLSILSPYINGLVIAAFYEADSSRIMYLLLYIACVNIFTIIISLVRSILISDLGLQIESTVKNDNFSSIIKNVTSLDHNDTGKLISIINIDSTIIAEFLSGKIIAFLFDIIYAIITLYIVVNASIVIGIIVVLCSIVSFYLFRYYGKNIKKKYRSQREINDKYLGFITQIINSMNEVKVLGISGYVKKLQIVQGDRLIKGKREVKIAGINSQVLLSVISQIESLMVMCIGAWLVLHKSINVALFVALLSYTQKFTSTITNLATANLDYQQFKVVLERCLRICENRDSSERKLTEGIHNGLVKFEQVSFGYANNSFLKIIQSANFSFFEHNVNTIIGRSGSGKTTIMNLICGLYDVDEGKVTIDNININKFNRDYLWSKISVVSQQPILFHMSIMDNLKIVQPEVDEKFVFECCKKANIHDFIMRLPNGYNTIIDENSANISGGQKQRISIARALIKKAPIIIFDEVTASLDNISQKIILETINDEAKSATVILIDHRYKHLTSDSNVIYIDSYNTIHQGKHNVLLSKYPSYKQLIGE